MTLQSAFTGDAGASSLIENTKFVTVTHEVPRYSIAQDLQSGRYELADGTLQTFRNWYSSKYPSIYVQGITALDEHLALDWGFSTGSYGEKYTISPAIRLGFRYRHELLPDLDLILAGYSFLGGQFREHSCVADYGAVGGVQTVNCRLAATPLRPDETLEYMINENKPIWGASAYINFYF